MTDEELLALVARAEDAALGAESTLEHVKKYHLKPLEAGKDGGFGFPVKELRIGSGLSFSASQQIGRLSSAVSPEHIQQLSDKVDGLFIVTESDFTSKLSAVMTDSFSRLSSCESSVADIQHRIDAIEVSNDSVLQRLTALESQLANGG